MKTQSKKRYKSFHRQFFVSESVIFSLLKVFSLKIFIFPIIIIIFCTANLFANWQVYDDYLELQASQKHIVQLITPADSNFFMVVDKDIILRKFSYEGELLWEKDLRLTSWVYHKCSADGVTAHYVSSNSNICGLYEEKWTTSLQNVFIENDSIHFKRDLFLNTKSPWVEETLGYLIYDYNFHLNTELLAYNIYFLGRYSGTRENVTTGKFCVRNLSTGAESSYVYKDWHSIINFSPNYNRCLFISGNSKSFEEVYGDLWSRNVNYYLKFKDYNSSIYNVESYYYEKNVYPDDVKTGETIPGIPESFCMPNEKNYFVT